MMQQSTSPSRDRDVDFGFSRVRLEEKQGLVDDVFHAVASRYDLMNDLMSGGMHRVWKDILVGMVGPSRNRPFRHLDVAGGTGDVAFRIADAGGPAVEVTVADINAAMLAVGEGRAQKRRLEGKVDFVEANAEELAVRGQVLRRLHDRLRHQERAAP